MAQTSEEELMSMPGSIFNQEEVSPPVKKDVQANLIERLHGDLRELLEASESGKAQRLRKARDRARNTLTMLEY